MYKNYLLLIPLIFLSACQLPNRGDVSADIPLNFNDSTIIGSNNGLLSDGLSKVPGTICIADRDTGKCNPEKLVPSQCLVQGTTVEIKPVTDPLPKYHSLITTKYNTNATVPFIVAPTSTEYVDEVKASISATASIKSIGTDFNNGYPGIDGIKACLYKAYGPGEYKKVIWIQAANVIAVTKSRFSKVSNGMEVTGTGFGFGGSTYNSNSVAMQTIWIGISGNAIDYVGHVGNPDDGKSTAKIISTENKTTIIETNLPATPPPAPESEPIIEQVVAPKPPIPTI